MKNRNTDLFMRAYIEALYFTEAGTDSEEIRVNSELAPETLEQIKADCAKFIELAGDLIPDGYTRPRSKYTDWEMAGHDFWLTRKGHGAGFWDGDWPEVGNKLTEISKQFGVVWVYLGDDGLIYLSE